MKKFLPFLSIAFIALFMVACNSKSEQTTQVNQQSDTTGLAAFNAWKAHVDFETQAEPVEMVAAVAPVQKKVTAKKNTVSRSTASNSSGSQNSSNNSVSQEPVILDNESASEAKAPEKKGWSKAAKGAVIGGVAGAAGGAAIHKKNRVLGAVVGAVVGAGGGYAIGREIDKKDGRYLIPH